MKLNSKFLTHETKGEHITVSTTGTKFNGLIRSNPTAGFIIEACTADYNTGGTKYYVRYHRR